MVLEVDNIELNFDTKKILNSIYIKAEKGKITGILGRNGSGKSCLLEIIFGSLKPKYKTIRINSKTLTKKGYAINKIAYLPQHALLPKKLKLSTAFKLYDLKWEDFISYFEHFKLYKNAKTNQLSSGELRVVETYLSICAKKEIILLDEPFSFIAPIYVNTFKKILVKEKANKLILITDHFYNDIISLSDTLYLITNRASKLVSNKQVLVAEGYLKR